MPFISTIGWQAVYGNNLHSILDAHGGSIEDRGRILGAELALWTENVTCYDSHLSGLDFYS